MKKLVFMFLLMALPLQTSWAAEGATDAIYIPIQGFIKQDKTLKGHSDSVPSVSFSPDGKTIASGSIDKTVILWDIKTGNPIIKLNGLVDPVHSISFSPDGKTLAAGSEYKAAVLWDIKTGTIIETLKGHSLLRNFLLYAPENRTSMYHVPVNSVSFSPNGKTLAAGYMDKTVILWDIETGKKTKTLEGHFDSVNSVSFSPDGKTLASGSAGTTVILWDIVTGKKTKTLKGHFNSVNSVSFSPDGKTLASGSADRTVILWDIVTGEQTRTLKGHSNSVLSVAFSPDSRILASGSGDHSIILWDVKTGRDIKTLEGHSYVVNSVAFSPDGKTLASGSFDKTIKLWNVSGIGIYLEFLGSDNIIPTIEFERDNKIIRSLNAPKGEFETTKEYEERLKIAKAEEGRIKKEYEAKIREAKDKAEMELKEKGSKLYPYSFKTTLGKYDADRAGFEADVLGEKVFVNISREKAMEVGSHKDNVNIQGMLKYFNNEKVELVNAFLVDNVSNERFAFGRHTEAVMTASTQKTPPDLAISSIALSEPSGNGILDAEETGKIKVVVKNIGKDAGFGVSLGFDVKGLSGIKLSEKTYIGTINPGEEKTAEPAITALEDIKTGEINLKATLLESNGFDSKPLILAFKTREFVPPLLQIAKIEIQDAEGKRLITKGKESQITLTIQNAGSGAAKGVVAGIDTGSGDVKLFGESKIAIGTLSPGESKKAVFSIAVTQRYSGEKLLPLSFSVKEERARFSIKPDIRLALNEESPDVKVVKVETREIPLLKAEAIEGIDAIPVFGTGEKVMGDNDIAVVIGIERYQGIPKSDYSYGDAKLVKEYLAALGFKERNIELITDEKATQSGIKKTIETWLPNRLKGNSRVVIYYSGHGAPETKTGDAYIVPFDGDPNYLEDTGYPLKRLYDKLGKLGASEVVVLLDSCFSGAGGRSVLAKGARPLVMLTEGGVLSQNIAVLSATQGTQISTSSPEKGHGIFTYYFLKALKDGKKDIAEIYSYIKPLVEDEAKQLNVQQSPSVNPDVEKLKGRFGLRK